MWITTGRDQAQVLKGLIDDSFTPDTDISVQLKLVPGNILLPATLAGEGPDVAMQIGEDVPVTYAMRGAAADLSRFADYDEVASRFRDSGLTPYKYDEGVFALPEQQTFPMLFYRKDILKELNTLPKYVVSTTLKDPEWANTTVLEGDAAAAVQELKEREGRELQVHGSGRLVQFLLDHDLVADLDLLVFPVIVGAGRRLFSDSGIATGLALDESRITGSGVTISVYQTT